ncbi:MAG: hypothetical protein ACOC7L_02320 [Acidobacteriota bacterium]
MSPGKHLGPSDFARVERLVEECMPDLLAFFENRALSHGEIDRIFFDALYRLAHRWDTIQDRRAWLLETLERFARQELAEELRPAEGDEAEGSDSSEGAAPENPEDRDGPGDPGDPDPRAGGKSDS